MELVVFPLKALILLLKRLQGLLVELVLTSDESELGLSLLEAFSCLKQICQKSLHQGAALDV